MADIGSKCDYPLNKLSNFACSPFEIDGVHCMSMEGFLQSLKFKEPEMQKEICKLVGYGAKKRGYGKNWWTKQVLYWNGVEYKRDSQEYQDLLDRAYFELSKNDGFRKALLMTGDSNLTHSIGKMKQSETILTRQEFCSRLMKLREILKAESIENTTK